MNNKALSARETFETLAKGNKIIDVRSSYEFLASSFPGQISIPILDDDQRKQVGTLYKEQGQKAAIELGESLVSGEVKIQRIQSWIKAIKQEHVVALTCARGGLRSQYAIDWLEQNNFHLPKVIGGYKALRNVALSNLESKSQKLDLLVLTGLTGSGKTELLSLLAQDYQVLDLEELAKHRGSSFGAFDEPQPSVATFENALSLNLAKLNCDLKITVEDESRSIGTCFIPKSLWERMSSSKRVFLDAPLEERALRIYQQYVKNRFNRDIFLFSLIKIRKKLGGVCFDRLNKKIANANDIEQHIDWIKDILLSYYDPSYRFSLEKFKDLVVYKGSRIEVLEYLSG